MILPGVAVLRRYQIGWLHHDIAAGAVLAALLVPQGIAYAELASLPHVAGLYATLVPLVAYALFGPSRILVLGPDSALAPLVAAAVVPIAGSDMTKRTETAELLAIIVGAMLLAAAVARLGFLTELLSKPVRLGFLGGVAAIVTVGQLPQLLGYAGTTGDLLRLKELGGLNANAAVIGVLALLFILLARRLSRAIPGVLIAVVATTALVWQLDLSVEVVGSLEGGLPRLSLPSPESGDVARLFLSAAAIALLVFADTSVLSRSYASRLGERVNQNHELAALGLANVATGLLQGFPISSSSSRTPVAEAAGSRTQLTGLIAAALLIIVLIAGTDLLRHMPQAALAAVMISAVLRLVDLGAVRRLLRVNRADFGLAVAGFFGVALFGILPGVGVAIGLSVLAVLQRSWHPYFAVLGRVSGLKGYHDIVRHPEGEQVPGLLLFRFDAPLFFANAEIFRDSVNRAIANSPPVTRLVIAAEPLTDIDSTAADVLSDFITELEQRHIELGFAEMKGPVKDGLRLYGLFDRLGEKRFYPTIGLAVRAYVQESGVEWHDWEEDVEEEGTPPN